MLLEFSTSWFSHWSVGAVGLSLGSALLLLYTQAANLKGSDVIFWRGVGPVLALLPFLFFIPWPSSPTFYVATITIGLIVSVFDRMILESAVMFGAGVTSRLLPLSTVGVFIIWLIIDSGERASLFADPVRASAIFACLALSTLSLALLKKCDVSKKALLFLLPTVAMAVAIDTLNKLAMDSMDVAFMHGMSVYIMIVSAFAGMGALVGRRLKRKKWDFAPLFTIKHYKACGVITCIILGAMAAKGWGVINTPNPAYVTSIGMSSSLWVLVIGRAAKLKDEGKVLAGLLFVASAIALVLLS